MRFPSKVTPYADSVLPDMVAMLKYLKKSPRRILEIKSKFKRNKWDLVRVVATIELLFALNKVKVSDEGGLIYAV